MMTTTFVLNYEFLGDGRVSTVGAGWSLPQYLSKCFSLSHVITPGEDWDALEASSGEDFQGFDVMVASGPGFTAAEEAGNTDSLIDRQTHAIIFSTYYF